MQTDTGRPAPRRGALRRLALLLAAPALLAAAAGRAGAAEAGVRLPPPAQDLPPPAAAGLQKAVFAGGCFWGVQGVFQHVKGVQRAVSGYAGGSAPTAAYALVSTGRTGHAEAVELSFDPAQVSYGALLQIFFSVAHDPTQLDRQGPDVGPQYRSAVFAIGPEQRQVAQAYIAQLDAAKRFARPIVTRLEAGPGFFPAEAEHQDFMTEHPRHPYIVMHDAPKLDELRRLFPERFRSEPVLVTPRR